MTPAQGRHSNTTVPRHIQAAANPFRPPRPVRDSSARAGHFERRPPANAEWHPFLILSATVAVALLLSLWFRPSPPAFPALPADLVLRGWIGQPVAAASAQSGGGELVISNSPERLDARNFQQDAVKLCQVMPDQPRFRVFLHHENATGDALRVGVALKNEGDTDIEIFLGRNSKGLDEGGRAKRGAERAAVWGGRALQRWFASRPADPSAPAQEGRPYCTLRPGQSCALGERVEPYGGVVTGMYDFEARGANASDTPPRVLVTTFAAKPGRVRPRDAARLPWAAPDGLKDRCRDLFRCNARQMDFDCAMDRIWRLDLGGGVAGPLACPIAGEYAPALTCAERINLGNYGVVYDLNARLYNPFAQTLRVKTLLNAAAGCATSTLMVDGQIKSSPQPLLQDHQSWVVAETVLQPGERRTLAIRFSLPGGSSGAHRLYFWPERVREQTAERQAD